MNKQVKLWKELLFDYYSSDGQNFDTAEVSHDVFHLDAFIDCTYITYDIWNVEYGFRELKIEVGKTFSEIIAKYCEDEKIAVPTFIISGNSDTLYFQEEDRHVQFFEYKIFYIRKPQQEALSSKVQFSN